MLQMERQLKIRNLLQKNGVVRISELSDLFAVSRNTARRDLKILEDQGFLLLSHGGALLNRQLPMGQTYGEREDRNLEEKVAIGLAAAALIAEGESIILDAGTTTVQIAKALKGRQELTVITNALSIAVELSGAPGLSLVLTGGALNDITKCMAGFHAEQFLSQFHVAKAFISAGGVTAEGVTNTNTFEVQIKKNMIAAAEKVILVAASGKIGKTSLAPFASITDFDLLITNRDAPPQEIRRIRERGLEVILC